MPLSLARAAGRCVAADYRDEAGGHDAVVPGEQDLAVYRSSTGTWFWRRSSTGNTEADYRGFGIEARGDVPVPGDYDGDGKTDPTVYRPQYGTWFALWSSLNYTSYGTVGWGAITDVPLGGAK